MTAQSSNKWPRLQGLIRTELQQLTTIHASDRVWQMPFAAALATGLPLLIAACFDRMAFGLVASIGGLVFLYLPNTPMHHRMVRVMACGFGLAACYCLGLLSHFVPYLMVPLLVFMAALATMVCRFFGMGPPGSLFFVMAASIGAVTPVKALDVPSMVGLLTMGSLLACLIGFLYSVYILRRRAATPVPPLPPASFDFVVFDSVVIGLFVGIALALAQALRLEKAYWVPISCLAVIQGSSLRAVWTRQLHRILGTSIGLLVAWGLLQLPLDKWSISLVLMALTFIIESIVVRHYALASVFITPLTILLAEAATMSHAVADTLVRARFVDTVLGCFVGLIGGVCLHSPRFRETVGRFVRYFVPSRFLA